MKSNKEEIKEEIQYWENKLGTNRNEKIELLKKLAANEAQQHLLQEFIASLKKLSSDVKQQLNE